MSSTSTAATPRAKYAAGLARHDERCRGSAARRSVEEDLDKVRQRIADMLPNERRAMLAAINLIADEIATA